MYRLLSAARGRTEENGTPAETKVSLKNEPIQDKPAKGSPRRVKTRASNGRKEVKSGKKRQNEVSKSRLKASARSTKKRKKT